MRQPVFPRDRIEHDVDGGGCAWHVITEAGAQLWRNCGRHHERTVRRYRAHLP
jgi:hypothetical protein